MNLKKVTSLPVIALVAAFCLFPGRAAAEGCTPGFWKNHLEYWALYSPGEFLTDVFVEAASLPSNNGLTLLGALESHGGKFTALNRHAVAALLNSVHPLVDYHYTEAQVLNKVNNAYTDGDWKTAKGQLEPQNQSGCPLGGPRLVGDLVWHDANGNQVFDSGETGIAGVDILLRDAATGSVIDSTFTDGNGLYFFQNVPPGSYHAEVDATDLGAINDPTFDYDDMTLPVQTPHTASFSLGSNDILRDVDFGYQEPGCVSDAECDDGLACNGAEVCIAGSCEDGTPLECDDGNACNGVETCDDAVGCQDGTPLSCDDGNVCNGDETCDPTLGCQDGTPLSCDDGDVCNGTESCDPTLGCQDGTPLSCDDGNACNGAETCDPTAGCQGGTPLTCNDGNVCNGIESCDPAVGCQGGTPLTCDDGNVCNGIESCDPIVGCQGGTPLVCDNGLFCDGVESCDPALGCQDEEDPCTGSQSCDEQADICEEPPPAACPCDGTEAWDTVLGGVATGDTCLVDDETNPTAINLTLISNGGNATVEYDGSIDAIVCRASILVPNPNFPPEPLPFITILSEEILTPAERDACIARVDSTSVEPCTETGGN